MGLISGIRKLLNCSLEDIIIKAEQQALEQRVMDLDPHMCKFPSVLPCGEWFTLYKGEAMQIRITVTADNVHRRFVVHIDMPNLTALRTAIENIINDRLPESYDLKVMSYLAPGRSLGSPLHANVNEGDFRAYLVTALHYVDKDSYDFGESDDSTAAMDAVISTIQRGRALEESVHAILLPLAKTLNDAYHESCLQAEARFKEFLEAKRTGDERYKHLIDEAVNKMEILSE